MNNTTFKFISLLLLLPIFSISQNIAVMSFDHKSKDLDAKVYYPKTDQNGDKCAIIKVVTSEKGFAWEGDGLGIVASEYKVGEYWIYVPYGAKRLTIKHPKLGILRNYPYPLSIKKGKVYEMKLTTGKVTTLVDNYIPSMQWVIISSEPEGASVYINDEYTGDTPYMEELELSSYTYRVEMSKYKPSVGKFELSDTVNKKRLTIKLIPDFSDVLISSIPESGAKIYLDGEDTEKITPCTLTKVSNGEHNISTKHKWYTPVKVKIQVANESENKLELTMKPIFGLLDVKANKSASIYIDGKFIANDSISLRLRKGYHLVEVKKDKYYPYNKKVPIIVGESNKLNIGLKPKQGTLKIKSNPFDAVVKLNGEEYGTTPITISNILIGDYELNIINPNYTTIIKNITIEENKMLVINEILSRGNPEWVKKGDQLFKNKEYSEAVKWYRKAAEQGDVSGQFHLGEMYRIGKGVTRDYNKTIKWYIKAAEQNNSDAQNGLGVMYETGQGISINYIKALEWYTKSAKQGNSDGQYNLGSMYYNARAVEQDYKKAIDWFRKSAEQGNSEGQNWLGIVYSNGYGVAQDYEISLEWYLKSAKQGNENAQASISYMYLEGVGVIKDDYEALKWIRKSAIQGNKYSQNKLGDMYYYARGTTKDYKEAFKWYTKSANQDFAEAQYNLGHMYQQGYGVRRKRKTSKIWFKKACDNGFKDACLYL